MASKVNTKFVVILSAVLIVAVIGVVGLAGFAMSNKGLRSIRQGDKLMAEGNYVDAEKAYGKAVSKDRTNFEWIDKWHGALKNIVPESQTKYEKLYSQHKSALLSKAQLVPTDAALQEAYIEEEYRFLRSVVGGSREGLERIVGEVEERASRLDPDSEGAKRLLRYRGWAIVDLMGVTDVGPEQREQAASDLVRALEVDPDDVQSGFMQARWSLLESLRHKADRNESEEQRLLDEHNTRLDALIAAHPNAPEPRRHKLQFARQMYFIEKQKAGESTANAAEAMAPLAQDVLDAVEASIEDPDVIERLMPVRLTVQQAVGRMNAEEVASLYERVMEQYPQNAEAMLQAGFALQYAGENERSIEVLDELLGLANMPVSLDGYLLVHRQDVAIGLQVDSYLAMWAALEDESDKEAALTNAKDKLEVLRTRLGTRGLTEVLLREAKLAVAEERYDSAVHKLTEYRGIVGDSLDAMSMLSHCLLQQGNYGEAKLALEDAIATHGRYEDLLYRLGEANIQLGGEDNYNEAYRIYSELLNMRPGNAAYQQRLGQVGSALRQILEESDPDKEITITEQDPIVDQMIKARELLSESNDAEGALAILDGLHEDNPGDVRIVMEYVRICSAFGLQDRALAKVRDGLAANPDDPRLQNALLQLEADDPVEGMVAVIENSAKTPLDKHLALFQLFLERDLVDRARTSLQEAVAIEQDNPRVVEAEFLLAMHEGDLARARSIAQRAATLNSDECGGMLFMGRVHFAEGQYREAAEAFTEALERNPHNPSVRRLLGESQAQLGRLDDAYESLMRAHEARPKDTDTIKSLTRVLVRLGRGAEALEIAKVGVSSDSSDIEVVEMWLTLAAEHGTDTEKATVERLRTERFESDPSNIQNSSALITLLSQQDEWDRAMGVVDAMREVEGIEPLRLIALESGVLAKRGDVDAGEALYRGHLDEVTDRESRLSVLLSLGRYLDVAGRHESAIEVMSEARAYQDPETKQADRMLGDLLFVMGGRAMRSDDEDERDRGRGYLERASEAYESVLDGGTDNEELASVVRKRLAETYLQLGDQSGVDRTLSALEGTDQEDLQTLQLRARMASQAGDRRAALEVLNRAAEMYPNEPSVFIQRAQLNMGDLMSKAPQDVDRDRDRSRDADIVADLKYVTEIRPGDMGAWSQLYGFYLRTRGAEDAVQQLREAVERNPDSELMRLMLIRQLFDLGRQGNSQMAQRFREEAEQLAKVAAEEHPDDVDWQRATGTVLRESGRFTEAVPILERTLELIEDDEDGKTWTATMLLDCYLQSELAPAKADVNPLLERLEPIAMENFTKHEARFKAEGEGWLTREDEKEEQQLRADAHGTILGLMLISRTKKFLDDERAAVELAGRALGACHDDAALSAAWFDELRVMFGDPDATVDFMTQMEEIGKQRGKQVLSPYLRVVFEGERWRRKKKTAEQVLASFEEIEPLLTHDGAKVKLHKLRSSVYYEMERYEESAEDLRKGLEYTTLDSEMNNNLAYIMVAHLQDYDAALPYAQAASKLNPNSSASLDTLGYVYLKLGRINDALDALQKAVDFAGAESERVVAKVHLGQAMARSGDIGGARRELDDVERAIREYPKLGADVAEDLETLRDEVE